jgi:hypothetical protein
LANIEEKNNPPLWFMILGIIIVSVAAYFVMLVPTKKYTQKDRYYLKDAQSSLIYQSGKSNKAINFVEAESNFWA